MARASTLLAIALLLPTPVTGGHGLTDSFTDIDWLPAPGATPGDPGYLIDHWCERVHLQVAGSDAARTTLRLEQARERLAETVSMLRAGDRRGAGIAMDHYERQIASIHRLSKHAETRSAQGIAARLADHLLQHQYIVSVEYPDLPRDTRAGAATIIAVAREYYGKAKAALGRQEKDALFFKEAETQWSWESAREADKQAPAPRPTR